MNDVVFTAVTDIILIISAIILHEYGHYYACILQKVPAQLELKKCRVHVPVHMSYRQDIIISSAGPIVGLIPILFTSDLLFYIFAYSMGCTMDFICITNLFMTKYKVSKPSSYVSFETLLLKLTHAKNCECELCLDIKRKDWINGKKFYKKKETLVVDNTKIKNIRMFKQR